MIPGKQILSGYDALLINSSNNEKYCGARRSCVRKRVVAWKVAECRKFALAKPAGIP